MIYMAKTFRLKYKGLVNKISQQPFCVIENNVWVTQKKKTTCGVKGTEKRKLQLSYRGLNEA